jgi:hypothetical protein
MGPRVFVYNATLLVEPGLREQGFGPLMSERLMSIQKTSAAQVNRRESLVRLAQSIASQVAHAADRVGESAIHVEPLVSSDANGPPDWMHATPHDKLGAILLSRALRSESLVHDGDRADVMLIPLTSDGASAGGEDAAGKGTLWPLCRRILTEDWTQLLPHLTLRSAARHVFLSPAAFDLWPRCEAVEPAFAFLAALSPSLPLLAAMPWPTHVADKAPSAKRSWPRYLRHLRTPSVAFPSHVHLRHSYGSSVRAPWSMPSSDIEQRADGARGGGTGRRRRLLMTVISLRDTDGTEGQPPPQQQEQRRRRHQLAGHLARLCQAYGPRVCRLPPPPTQALAPDVTMDAETFRLMREAVFCVVPMANTNAEVASGGPSAGVSSTSSASPSDPTWRSIVDALLLGCIPVVFEARGGVVSAEEEGAREAAIAHSDGGELWGSQWATTSRLRLSEHELLSGRLELRAALAAVPQPEIDRIRSSMARDAPRLHYSLNGWRHEDDGRPTPHVDADEGGDAYDAVLHLLVNSSSRGWGDQRGGGSRGVQQARDQHVEPGDDFEEAAGLPRDGIHTPSCEDPPDLLDLKRAIGSFDWPSGVDAGTPAVCASLVEKLGCSSSIARTRSRALVSHICVRTCGRCRVAKLQGLRSRSAAATADGGEAPPRVVVGADGSISPSWGIVWGPGHGLHDVA